MTITHPSSAESKSTKTRPQAAVIINSSKFLDPRRAERFRRDVFRAFAKQGWDTPMWLPTTGDSHGKEQARSALSTNAKMIMVAGGDGTVREVAQELAGTDRPLGILPLGTGNLLARNLGVPLQEVSEAIKIACSGADRRIDLGWLEIPAPDDTKKVARFAFTVMGGAGFDAMTMRGARSRSKKLLGPFAYILSGIKAFSKPLQATQITSDGSKIVNEPTHGFIIGNFGDLMLGVSLLPGADPTDGCFEGVVLRPRSIGQWISAAWNLLFGASDHAALLRFRGRRLQMRCATPQLIEVDGDVVAESTSVTAWIQPRALRVRRPLHGLEFTGRKNPFVT
ncbi:hypothetical protein NBM05_03960 [Rothia sp. AR01]|uniref:DAGKc domain-containing protein n=1 Tax=Rothia santali TaxID=2949643 RepID=A0A9X2HCI5_9MICC|nr:diacylglycerol kinase family protein [Rothia santali]MCP3425202.1 hypothetical protein [Rothia santali]